MSKRNVDSNIVEEFKRKRRLYDQFQRKLKQLLHEILRPHKDKIHTITGRTKSIESLRDKVSEKEVDYYSALSDITDLCGLRIITYFSEDVDKIAEFIIPEFEIDDENSSDKRTLLLEAGKFGYLSLHHVAQLTAKRLYLTEYKPFDGLKFELQIRSVLQHAWAEIEHDLGYKSRNEVPREIRRKFSMIAGLLELADEQFDQIRGRLKNYETQVPKRIKDEPESVNIDKASLDYFILNNPLVRKLDKRIAKNNSSGLRKTPRRAEHYIDRLLIIGIETIDKLEDDLNKHYKEILEFAGAWSSLKSYKKELRHGISIDILWFLTLAKTESEKSIAESIKAKSSAKITNASSLRYAKSILSVYGEMQSSQ